MVRWTWFVACAGLGCLSACRIQSLPAPAPSGAPTANILAVEALDRELADRVRQGFGQIFRTYDRQPTDDRLSFLEFGKVVTWEWFDERDANDDDLLALDEWLTPQELQRQVQGMKQSGASLVRKADRNGDGGMSLPEFEAHRAFEIDPTPWLAGPPDPQVRQSFHRLFAKDGLVDAVGAARMVGALLAQGYYLDEAEARLWPKPRTP